MGKSTIKITGESLKLPKTNEEGITELIIKNEMGTALPKGLKPLGHTIYRILIAQKTWNKFIKATEVSEDTFYIIEGEPKASLTKKGTPVVTVNALTVQSKVLKPKEEKIVAATKDEPKDEIKKVKDEPKKTKDEKPKPKKKDVFTSNDWLKTCEEIGMVELDINLIDLELKEHMYSNNIPVGDKVGINTPISVRLKEDGRYVLNTGHKAYVSHKIYRADKPIKAIITDLTRQEILKKYHGKK